MKESLWGYWLIALGIGVITLMMLLQNYTTIDQEDYYLLKEVTQAALYDAIDYEHYNKYGELRIHREVFIEVFERRFANSVKSNKTYKTDFYEIYESPPKVSVRISTKTSSFNISNEAFESDVISNIDSILESQGKNIFTTDFYSLGYASCEDSNKDAMGYCYLMNNYSMFDNKFKEKASKDMALKYPSLGTVPATNFNIVSIEYIGPMTTNNDFIKYRDNYENTYGTPYNSLTNGISPGELIETDHYADEIKDVVVITRNADEGFGWSLKYKCTTPKDIKLQSGDTITNNCLIGLKYRIKFKYT